jgi:hypothetical protein
MRSMYILVSVLFVLSDIGCHQGSQFITDKHGVYYNRSYPPVKSGWKNLYQGNDMLAGIAINQIFPEGSQDQTLYDGKHPAGIAYYFWDGTRIEYWYFKDKSAKVYRLEIKHYYGDVSPDEWKWVDFLYGSDSTFKSHPDPRIHGLVKTFEQIHIHIINEDFPDGKRINGELTVFNGKSTDELKEMGQAVPNY